MVPAMSLFERYADLEAHYNAVTRETNGDRYVGETPTRLWTVTEPGSYGSLLRPDQVAGTVDTAEVALDTRALRGILRDALHGHPLVTAEYGCSVHEATRAGNGFRVSGTRGEEPWAAEAGVVVNCLWTSRLQLDAQLGLAPERPCVHRLKYRVLGRLPADLAGMPSLSFVLGPYGDVVVQPGSPAYLSWYPSCATETAHALGSPAAWQPTCAGSPDLAMADEIAARDRPRAGRARPESRRLRDRARRRRRDRRVGQHRHHRSGQRAPSSPRDRGRVERRMVLDRHRQVHDRSAVRVAARPRAVTVPRISVGVPLHTRPSALWT